MDGEREHCPFCGGFLPLNKDEQAAKAKREHRAVLLKQEKDCAYAAWIKFRDEPATVLNVILKHTGVVVWASVLFVYGTTGIAVWWAEPSHQMLVGIAAFIISFILAMLPFLIGVRQGRQKLRQFATAYPKENALLRGE